MAETTMSNFPEHLPERNNPERHLLPGDPGPTYQGLATAAWVLVLLACGLSVIPFLGFLAWFISIPIFIAVFVLAILILTRGGVVHGVSLLFMAIIVGPVFIFIAPIVTSTLGFGVAAVVSAPAMPPPVPPAQTQDLLGTWWNDQHQYLEFLADGSYSVRAGEEEVSDGQRHHWKLDSSDLTLETDGVSEKYKLLTFNPVEFSVRDKYGRDHRYGKNPRP